MTDLFKPLFSSILLARRLTGFSPTQTPELMAIADQWARTAADPAFLNLKGKPLHRLLADHSRHAMIDYPYGAV